MLVMVQPKSAFPGLLPFSRKKVFADLTCLLVRSLSMLLDCHLMLVQFGTTWCFRLFAQKKRHKSQPHGTSPNHTPKGNLTRLNQGASISRAGREREEDRVVLMLMHVQKQSKTDV